MTCQPKGALCHDVHRRAAFQEIAMPTKPSSRRRVKCPCCGKTITVEVVSSLRPGDKHLAALMTGTLNRATCSDCKVEFLVETPLVYLDGQTSFIVYLLEPPEDGNTEALEREVDCMATEVFSRENLERPLVRLTFTYPDFIEKIKLRTLGYDDRLIEYAKYQLFQNISKNGCRNSSTSSCLIFPIATKISSFFWSMTEKLTSRCRSSMCQWKISAPWSRSSPKTWRCCKNWTPYFRHVTSRPTA